jgi:hypothetical protein
MIRQKPVECANRGRSIAVAGVEGSRWFQAKTFSGASPILVVGGFVDEVKNDDRCLEAGASASISSGGERRRDLR